jgi:hypothetical protein
VPDTAAERFDVTPGTATTEVDPDAAADVAAVPTVLTVTDTAPTDVTLVIRSSVFTKPATTVDPTTLAEVGVRAKSDPETLADPEDEDPTANDDAVPTVIKAAPKNGVAHRTSAAVEMDADTSPSKSIPSRTSGRASEPTKTLPDESTRYPSTKPMVLAVCTNADD